MKHPLELFERIYVINLATRADRRAEMDEQLKGIGLSLRSPNVRLFEAFRPVDDGGFPSIGARGCFMSHLGVLRDATAAGFERILILEDDLNFAADFLTRAPRVLSRIAEPDCAMFYGGYESDRVQPTNVDWAELPPESDVRTSHFLGLKAPAIDAAAGYLEAILAREPGHREGGPMHVDGAYSWFRREHPELRTFVAVPVLGYQRSSRTDIHELRWYDKLLGVRHIAAGLRRARNG